MLSTASHKGGVAIEFSVVIPVYNAALFLDRAIRSVLAQPQAAEVLLAEDGSSDESLAICHQFLQEDARIRIVRHAGGRNQGAAATRNLGARNASYDYVAFLDADDFYLPHRFCAAQQLLSSRADVDAVCDTVATLRPHPSTYPSPDLLCKPDLYTISKGTQPAQLFGILVCGQSGRMHLDGLTVRKSCFERVGGFDENLRVAEDTAFFIKLAAAGRLALGANAAPVAMRRLRSGSLVHEYRDRYPLYHIEMWHTLLRWGKRERLPRKRRLLLLDALIRSWYRDIECAKRLSGIGHRIRECRFLLALLMRYPFAMGSVTFRSRFARACGWLRASRGVGGLFSKPKDMRG